MLGFSISGMKFAQNKEKINEAWKDYQFFDDIYKKLNVIWKKIKILNDKQVKIDLINIKPASL